ncbi:type VII secretion protein EssC [Erysipelotrichaceae bacterium]|nr:type VII secretion protein EssC [Erysipelotrichaceae bacterium]
MAKVYIEYQEVLIIKEIAGEGAKKAIYYELTPAAARQLDIPFIEKTRILPVAENKVCRYDFTMCKIITLGGDAYDTITLNHTKKTAVIFVLEGENLQVIPINSVRVYCNAKQKTKTFPMRIGDILYCGGMEISFSTTYLQIRSFLGAIKTSLIFLGEEQNWQHENLLKIKRSPRMIKNQPQTPVKIKRIPSLPQKPSDDLWKLLIPTGTMVIMTVLVQFIQPRGLYAIIGLMGSIISALTTSINWKKSQRKYKNKIAGMEHRYSEYLQKQSNLIYKQCCIQEAAVKFHFPNSLELVELLIQKSARIYEKKWGGTDFLVCRIGMRYQNPSFEISFEDDGLEEIPEKLSEMHEYLRVSVKEQRLLPHTISLDLQTLGFIGLDTVVQPCLELLICQLTFFHSYHDVIIIPITTTEQRDCIWWMRWFPHMRLTDINMRSFVYDSTTRDIILGNIYDILKKRQQKKRIEQERCMQYFPHYVLIVLDGDLIVKHPIMEFSQCVEQNLGVCFIFVEQQIENLGEYVKDVIVLEKDGSAVVMLKDGQLSEEQVKIDLFEQSFKKSDYARAFAPLSHEVKKDAVLPTQISFMELYGEKNVEDLEVLKRWEKNAPYKSLAVPIGVKTNNDIVLLNLHEKAHGPHGLIAGTTGSGKSEVIQTYILSLAVNFAPTEVGFLLIDYKGGGMANLFKDLPHNLGAITNLDKSASIRALTSIKAELKKRQELFTQLEVNHISQYQQYFRDGKVIEPLPSLFIIADEFAELKAEQPEFMKELVSTARIGRSLGIHLILATQKPSGVVDDQIWSNAKFKIALKVADRSDSNEILKTPDAAAITITGRAYLQVGNNELYELFQSAWSGATYQQSDQNQKEEQYLLFKINSFGQYEVLNKDLRIPEKIKPIAKKQTELAAIIHEISCSASKSACIEVKKPWLPPLGNRFSIAPSPRFIFSKKADNSKEYQDLEVEIGILDQPEWQSQKPLQINLTTAGHMLIISSPGFGKSTTLQTIIMQLTRRFTPERLHVYLLDFGVNGLLPLKDLPHSGAIIRLEEEEKLRKFLGRIAEELEMRKRKFSEYSITNLKDYTALIGEIFPSIVIIVDDYDMSRELKNSEEFQKVFLKISREGQNMGIHLVLSMANIHMLRGMMQANIKLKLVQYLHERLEVIGIIGRGGQEIMPIAGRGLINLSLPTLCQIGLPAAGVNNLEVMQNLLEEVKIMHQSFTKGLPKIIPIIPQKLIQAYFYNQPTVVSVLEGQQEIPLGLDIEIVESITSDFANGAVVIVTNTRRQVQKQLALLQKTMKLMPLVEVKELCVGPVDLNLKDTQIFERIDIVQLEAIFNLRRVENFIDWHAQLIKLIVPIFQADLSQKESRVLQKIIAQGHELGMHLILIGEYNIIMQLSADIRNEIKQLKGVIIQIRLSTQMLYPLGGTYYNEDELQEDEGYWIRDGKSTRMKFPFEA